MWLIFIASCVFISMVALLVIWIANKVFLSIRKQNKIAEMEESAYESTKKIIQESIEKENENEE